MIDRSEINRALAKAIAYKQCGNGRKATAWAAQLLRLLDQAQLIDRMAANTSIELLDR